MRKDQEARILSNQVVIMEALAFLAMPKAMGGGAKSSELRLRALDTQQFIQDYLK